MLGLEDQEQVCTLGALKLSPESFPRIEEAFSEFAAKEFTALPEGERRSRVSEALLGLIQEAPKQAFLLPAVVDFIDRVAEEELLDAPYGFGAFELWLNEHSFLSWDENYRVRAQIVGKYVPRDEYQAYFPIGLGRIHRGTHFVSAHNPPDLDTAVASFWGWVDAFGARVGDGLHVWNLPGGGPPKAIAKLFSDLMGSALFSVLPRSVGTLGVRAVDLLTQEGLERPSGDVRTLDLDHNVHQKLVVLVDAEGRFLGSWRSGDVEGYRLACLLINELCRSFHTHASLELMALLKAPVDACAMEGFVTGLLQHPLEPADLPERHRALLERMLKQVFGLKKGLAASYGEFLAVLPEYRAVTELLLQLPSLEGTAAGALVLVERLLRSLWQASEAFRCYLERLDVAVRIKHEVLGLNSPSVSPRSSLDEVVEAMGAFSHLPVVERDSHGALYPIGVIHRSRLQQKTLGTIALRDFCNRDEVKIADHLEVISVVDHHRASLQTLSFPTALMGDVQSSNTLLAEQAFQINDRYGLGGLTEEGVLDDSSSEGSNVVERLRAVQRRVRAQLAAVTRGGYFVSPRREFAEYLCFLYAILDDTDLLSRVSARDVLCVAELLNRLKSLQVGKHEVVVSLEDLPRDDHFASRAAQRMLQNEEMYSLYSRVYKERERNLTADLELCVAGESLHAFADTKEQKAIALVGQIKLLPGNFAWFGENAAALRGVWLGRAQEIARANAQLDLHLQMVSTIAGAEEVYHGTQPKYAHEDELWLWAASTEQGYDRLGAFLRSFRTAPEVSGNCISVALIGGASTRLQRLFTNHFALASTTQDHTEASAVPMAVMRFRAGSITSRKASITPHLPGR